MLEILKYILKYCFNELVVLKCVSSVISAISGSVFYYFCLGYESYFSIHVLQFLFADGCCECCVVVILKSISLAGSFKFFVYQLEVGWSLDFVGLFLSSLYSRANLVLVGVTLFQALLNAIYD